MNEAVKVFRQKGFDIWATGGGNQALGLNLEKGYHVLVTDKSGCGLPTETDLYVGLHTRDNQVWDQGGIVTSVAAAVALFEKIKAFVDAAVPADDPVERVMIDVRDVDYTYWEDVSAFLAPDGYYHFTKESAERLGDLDDESGNYLFLDGVVEAHSDYLFVDGQKVKTWSVRTEELTARPSRKAKKPDRAGGLTAHDLARKLLAGPDLPVHLSYLYGDYWGTRVAPAVKKAETERITPNGRYDLPVVTGDDGTEVVILS